MNTDKLKHLCESPKQIQRLLSDSWIEKRSLIKTIVIMSICLAAWFLFLWVMTDIAVDKQIKHKNQHSEIQSQLDSHIQDGHKHD